MTRLSTHLRNFHDGIRRTEQIYMVLVAVVIGLLGGFCAVGFRLLIQAMNRVFWHEGQYTLEYLYSLPFWWKISAPAVGGLIVGWIVYRFAREAKGHGVPEVMEAVALKGGRIRPRVVIAKMFASGISIGSGSDRPSVPPSGSGSRWISGACAHSWGAGPPPASPPRSTPPWQGRSSPWR